MSRIIRFGIKTADQTMGFGGIGTKAKVDMERARAEVGMLLDRQKRGEVMRNGGIQRYFCIKLIK